MFGKILIANRGEIALRIQRACRELGIRTVVAHSEADRDARYVKLADESVCIGPAAPGQSYLNAAAIISAAVVTDAEAIHPGYGFLSENADFAERVESSGFVFIGPHPETLRLQSDMLRTREAMQAAGLPCVPGSQGALPEEAKEIIRLAREIGYPVIIKAAGGRRVMRVVYTEAALVNAVTQTRAEAQNIFANPAVYLEKYLENPRHVEIQILADGLRNAIHLGERDASLQRRQRKVIEESPAPGIAARHIARLGERCTEACRRLHYRGAGSFEFLHADGEFYFAHLNARLQTGHPVSEVVSGIDLVQQQIRIAAGEKLTLRQRDVNLRGYAIECRINAEDPATLAPCPGKVSAYLPPGGPGIRVDSPIYQGYTLPPHYEPLLAKVTAHGETREQAIRRLRIALAETCIEGIKTNIPLLQELLHDAAFIKGGIGIHYLETKIALKNAARRAE